jgi:hypothetical protein
MNLTSSLEVLEARIAPAALATLTVVGTKATYKDVDGDKVTVVIAGGTTPVTTGLFSGGAGALGDQLQTIDLSAGGFDHASITVTVKRATTGDGLANIGYINSTGHDLGAVSILGDLGQIDAGDGITTVASPAIKSLKVNSLGHRGIDTQGGSSSLESDLTGGLGSLTVTHDFDGAFLKVSGAMAGMDDAAGSIGPIKIGGSLIGRAANDSGEIKTSGKMGTVSITEDLRGDSGARSGMLNSASDIGAVTIGGSILGGSLATGNSLSGAILSLGTIGAVKVTHDVVYGGGSKSAYIQAGDIGVFPNPLGKLVSLTIGGSLIGNSALGGTVESAGNMGPVKISGSIVGGLVNSFGTMGTVNIAGSVLPGGSTSSGVVSSNGNMGQVTIGHDIQGTSVLFSGLIFSGGNITGVKVGGSIIGGPANLAVGVNSTGGIQALGDLGPVTVAHDVIGGRNGTFTGMQGGTMFTAQDLSDSGFIEAGGRITSIVIGGSIFAGAVTGTGTLERSGAIVAGDDLGSLTVKGSIVGNRGNGGANTQVFIAARGQSVPKTGLDLAIGKITVGHRVENAQILAGYNQVFSKTTNANAQIGPVVVNGAWIASSLVAGAQNFGANHTPGGGDDNVNFGNPDDTLYPLPAADDTLAKIASITIKGTVSGTLDSISATDHFGFVAQAFGVVKINGVTVVTPAMAPGFLDIGETNDVSVHRLA